MSCYLQIGLVTSSPKMTSLRDVPSVTVAAPRDVTFNPPAADVTPQGTDLRDVMSGVQSVGSALAAEAGRVAAPGAAGPRVASHVRGVGRVHLAVFGRVHLLAALALVGDLDGPRVCRAPHQTSSVCKYVGSGARPPLGRGRRRQRRTERARHAHALAHARSPLGDWRSDEGTLITY